MYAVGDLVTVKDFVIEDGWDEFDGKIGEIVRVYDKSDHNALFQYIVFFEGTFRSSGEFGFDHEELEPFCTSDIEG